MPMNRLIWTIVASILFASSASAADKLLQPSDLTYLGAFRVPHTDMGDTGYGLSYGGEVIGYNPTNNSLFITGATQHQKVAEISIPTPVNSATLSNLNTATALQNLYDITDGSITLHYVGNKIGSLTPFGDYILGSVYMYYDNSAGIYSHFLSSKTLSSGSDFAGLYNVTPSPAISGVTDYVSYLSGPITSIPDNTGSGGTNWQSALGGTYLSGQSAVSTVSRMSFGPATAFSFDPTGLSNSTTAQPLIYYDPSHRSFGEWDHNLAQNDYISLADTRSGLVFPDGSQTVISIGIHGTGANCYGLATSDIAQTPGYTGSTCGGDTVTEGESCCYDLNQYYKGTHSYPYYVYAYFYDALWLKRVKDGYLIQSGDISSLVGNPVEGQAVKPWNLKPYTYTNLSSTMVSSMSGYLMEGGAAYDPSTQRLYVVSTRSDGDYPLVHVYQVSIEGSSDTTAPVITSFSMPSTATSTTVSVSSFTATDAVGVTGFCITTVNSSSGCSWSGSAPTTATGSAGANTWYAWAKDAAGNVSTASTASTTITLTGSVVAKINGHINGSLK